MILGAISCLVSKRKASDLQRLQTFRSSQKRNLFMGLPVILNKRKPGTKCPGFQWSKALSEVEFAG